VRYYREHVIGGPGAFVVAASDYADFTRAMHLKLIEEISGRPAAEGRHDPWRHTYAPDERRPPDAAITIATGGSPWKAGAIARH
jgi:hypothetical protein